MSEEMITEWSVCWEVVGASVNMTLPVSENCTAHEFQNGKRGMCDP